jgi:hypothetical protein
MKKIANFTQTYSTNRYEIIENFVIDKGIIHLLNNIDKKYYSFHNLSHNLDYCRKIKDAITPVLENTTFMGYNFSHYAPTYVEHLKILKDSNITDCFFTQDDVICVIKDKNLYVLDDILTFYRENNDVQMLNLDNRQIARNLISQGCNYIQKRLVSKQYNLWAYEFKTTEWLKTSLWSMDDSTYLGNVDLLLELYNDPNFLNHYNMDKAEVYIKEKCERLPISRWVLDKSIFRYFSYNGMHVYTNETRESELKLLNKVFKHKTT